MNDLVTETTLPAEAAVVETPVHEGEVLVQTADQVGEEVLAQDPTHTA